MLAGRETNIHVHHNEMDNNIAKCMASLCAKITSKTC